jgi:spoIIIAH
MINKKNIWFLTLFSLILVLSVYYITMPSELLLTNFTGKELETSSSKDTNVSVEESTVIAALKVQDEEERLEELDSLKLILMDTKSTVDEKNKAFEKMKNLDINKAEETKLEEKIKTEFNLESFIKIENDKIKVVVDSDKNDTSLANKIMRSIQSNYTEKMYITVEFK